MPAPALDLGHVHKDPSANHPAPPRPAPHVELATPSLLFVWDDPEHPAYRNQVLLALAPSAERARELIAGDAANDDARVLAAFRAWRQGNGPLLDPYRTLWTQLAGEPWHLTGPVGMRLRPWTPR